MTDSATIGQSTGKKYLRNSIPVRTQNSPDVLSTFISKTGIYPTYRPSIVGSSELQLTDAVKGWETFFETELIAKLQLFYFTSETAIRK